MASGIQSGDINEGRKSSTCSPIFPLNRFMYSQKINLYFPFHNFDTDDLLKRCTGELKPSVLLLGCGEIRCCLYTLWKHFDSSNPDALKRFDGVEFTINDRSAAVQARNIILLYLCLKLPEEDTARRKWLSGMWAIWYCHELYSNHQTILNDSLTTLLKYSQSLEEWASKDNPLNYLVKFTSLPCLASIAKVWEMWISRTEDIISVKEIQQDRKKILATTKINIDHVCSLDCYYKKYIYKQLPRDLTLHEKDVKSYILTGNCFAEGSLNVYHVKNARTTVNLTLYERQDWTYTFTFYISPYMAYYHTVEFSPRFLESIGKSPLPNDIVVSPPSFKQKPLLANSVQQFIMWVQSTNRALLDKNVHISFSFNTQDALTFCQEVQQNKKKGKKKKARKGDSIEYEVHKYDVIHTSNLSFSLSLPNLILATIPLLKDDGLIFTSMHAHKSYYTIDEFIRKSFGFSSEMLPVILGIRCINHEGSKFASSTLIEPSLPFLPYPGIRNKCYKRGLGAIWEKVSGAQPLKFPFLPPIEQGNISHALCQLFHAYTYTLFGNKKGIFYCNARNIETVVWALVRFVSLSDIAFTNFTFWEPLCISLRNWKHMQPFLHGLQTQMLLHDIHAHLMVTEKDCPLCTQVPLHNIIVQLHAEIKPSVHPQFHSHFLVVFKNNSLPESIYDLEEDSFDQDFHIIDCMDGTFSDVSLEIKFFVPLIIVKQKYDIKVIVISYKMAEPCSTYPVPSRCVTISTIPMLTYNFIKPDYSLKAQLENETLGKVHYHICDGLSTETRVVLTKDSELEPLSIHNLNLVQLSPQVLKISCSSQSLLLKYCYPIDYSTLNMEISEDNKKLVITCPRQAQRFEEESPFVLMNPDHHLSILPLLSVEVNMDIILSHSRCQFLIAEKIVGKSGNISPTIAVKQTLQAIFGGCQMCFYFQFLSYEKETLGYIIVNEILFDYQYRTPALDLAFSFLNHCDIGNIEDISSKWKDIMCPTDVLSTNTIEVDKKELKLLKQMLDYFARGTNGNLRSVGRYGRYDNLRHYKLDHLFTRAIVFYLLPNINTGDQLPDDIAPTSSQSEGGEHGRKCDICGQQRLTCTKCDQYIYCSKLCKLKHKEDHTCESSSDIHQLQKGYEKINLQKRSSRKCSYCRKRSDFLECCPRCEVVKYCDECTKKHLKEHKMVCRETTKAPPDDKRHLLNPATRLYSSECTFCNMKSEILKICQTCNSVLYCTEDCLKKHQHEHKELYGCD